MRKERIDDLVDILSEEYSNLENTFLIRNNEQLAKYLENPEDWKREQMRHRNAYKQVLISDARERLRILNEKTEKVFLLSYREVAKDQIEITEKEIVAKNIPEDVRKKIIQYKKTNTEEVLKLANQSFKTYTRDVRVIASSSTPETLYNVVKRQMKRGIDNGIKITYRDGKQFSWKAYMEMKIRTDIQHEISDQQIKVGASVGQIFYLCDSFGDCAPDHANYQGKMYYNADADISDEIMQYIQENGIESMQSVRDGEPYLTTRPNCRHTFHAIPTSEAMGMSENELLGKYDLSKGKYDAENYDKVQEQRYNERQIRKYKLQVENEKQLAKETGVKDFAPSGNAIAKIREYQARNRELAKNNPEVIKRDYDREKIGVITNDLGVRYDYKVKDGELIKKRR